MKSARSKVPERVLREEIELLLQRRRWILEKLKEFEVRYGMSSEEFYRKWTCGSIPEPEDPTTLAHFLTWQDLVEELHEVDRRLSQLIETG